MRLAMVVWMCGVLGAPAMAGLINTQHFGSLAEVQTHILGGLDFVARGDTQELRITRADPPGSATAPVGPWNNGVPHAFKVVYNAGGVAGISIDELYTVQVPVTINPATNGLLITAFVDGAGRGVTLGNLRITLPGFIMHEVGDAADAPPTDYMLVDTSLPLVDGFILSGTVQFNWTGGLPPPAEQWFEVAPVVIPEPATVLLLAGGVLTGLRRRS